ncbi:unnamed protein product [Polarella glacialis]|uniref:RING-type domain-containing protein n=1 Tax=Polarella glacialis TaxID=89957 RepID=A0A813ITM6_POLGL|nr:unnamed protein product [Polarella glacialis]
MMALPYKCDSSVVCLDSAREGCCQQPLEHASCASKRQATAQLFRVPLAGRGGAAECSLMCEPGFHQARFGLDGSVECRRDGSEQQDADIMTCVTGGCLVFMAVVITLLRGWQGLKGHVSARAQILWLERHCPGRLVCDTLEAVNAECAICLNAFLPDEYVRIIPCPAAKERGHTFHSDCIDRWLSTNPRCPLCNSNCSALMQGPASFDDASSEDRASSAEDMSS